MASAAAAAAIAFAVALFLLVGAEAKDACDPAGAVGRVASSCAAGVASAGCCKALFSPVDLVGGIPCFCSAAAQPHLAVAKLTSLKIRSLYRSCTGGLRGGGAHLPTACQEGERQVLASAAEVAGCDGEKFGYQVDRQCLDGTGRITSECCEAVTASVDIKGCLCQVMNSSSMVWSSSLSVRKVLDIYKMCGGLRRLDGQTDCEEIKMDVPSSGGSQDSSARAAHLAPATPSNDDDEAEEIARRDYVLDGVQLTLEVIAIVSGLGYFLTKLFQKFQSFRIAAQQEAIDTTVQNNLTRFLASMRDEMRLTMQEQVNLSVRQAVRGMLPARTVRTINMIGMGETEIEHVDDDDHEAQLDGAIATAKKRKAVLKGDMASTSDPQT